MKAKFITFKSNRDGSVTLFFEPGLNKHELLDLEGSVIEVSKPKETESEQYLAGIEAGRVQLFEEMEKFIASLKGEQK